MQLSDLEPTIAKLKTVVADEDVVLESLRKIIEGTGNKATEQVFLEKSNKWLKLSAPAILSVISNQRDADQAQLEQYQALYKQLQDMLSGAINP